jgi:hypothetical protein
MKATILAGFLLTLFALSADANERSLKSAAPLVYQSVERNIFVPLFGALRAGELSAISRYLSADTKAIYQTLFEQNRDYSGFLRRYYKGAEFELNDAYAKDDDVYIGVVSIYWPDGRHSVVDMPVTAPSFVKTGNDKN